MADDLLLSLMDLNVVCQTDEGIISLVDGVSFDVYKGKTLGIVGESGCGKSMTALSLIGLLPSPNVWVQSGQCMFEHRNLFDNRTWSDVRGKRIAMVFQDPMTALNPVQTIGQQVFEVLEWHNPNWSRSQYRTRALTLLNQVQMPLAESQLGRYPHQLSGGMRQRVVIAMALACDPEILICDEPTTALDVTIQAQILQLLQQLQKETQLTLIFITHDLGVVAQICDDVVVLYAGQTVEYANVFELFESPKHPYTKGLLKSMPTLFSAIKSRLPTIDGQVPSLQDCPSGCRFHPRCAYATDKCSQLSPLWRQNTRCHYVGEIL
jgi:peptide/nickel transport system ATP-binding protein